MDDSRGIIDFFLFQDNIALAALLETKDAVWDTSCPQPSEARQQLLVCTAHIHWDPEFCDVKLIQSMMLVDQLKRLIAEYSAKPSLHNNPIQVRRPFFQSLAHPYRPLIFDPFQTSFGKPK